MTGQLSTNITISLYHFGSRLYVYKVTVKAVATASSGRFSLVWRSFSLTLKSSNHATSCTERRLLVVGEVTLKMKIHYLMSTECYVLELILRGRSSMNITFLPIGHQSTLQRSFFTLSIPGDTLKASGATEKTGSRRVKKLFKSSGRATHHSHVRANLNQRNRSLNYQIRSLVMTVIAIVREAGTSTNCGVSASETQPFHARLSTGASPR
jgi:hypothetical protein